MLINLTQAIYFTAFPLFLVTSIMSEKLYRLRSKQGYRVLGIGQVLLLMYVLLKLLVSATHITVANFHTPLYLVGWYVTLFGLLQLHMKVPKRIRYVLVGGIGVWLGVGFLPDLINASVSAVGLGVASFMLWKWAKLSARVFWLSGVLTLSELIRTADSLMDNLWLENVKAVSFVAAASLGLALMIQRVSDVLVTSHKSSITDGLTGLYNRRYFNSLVKRYVDRGIQVSVVFVDLDNFKKLNDTKGHDAGDEALKTVASILNDEMNGKGIAGRYGGEEMVLLITKGNLSLEDLTERIRQRIERESPVTASIGFASFIMGINAEELINRADKAMYYSKTNGKNKVTGYAV